MITARNRDRSNEINVYGLDDRVFTAFNRAGACLERITVPAEALTDPCCEIETPTVNPNGH